MKDIDVLGVLAIAYAVIIFIFMTVMIYLTVDMLNDHYCYTLPLDEFYKEPKCEKYWDIREEK